MPNQVDSLLSQSPFPDSHSDRGSYLALRSGRRRAVLGLVAFASLRLLAACSDNGSGGTNPNADMAVPDLSGTGGGDGDGGVFTPGDLALPVTPPAGDFRLSVGVGGSGSGLVASQPGIISCGPGPTPVCSADYPSGTQVTLTASGSAGSSFTSWTGACAGQGATCTLNVTASLSTTAIFGVQNCTPDGVCWEAPLPFGFDLNSVYAITASNVWAVGNGGSIVHYDGKNWSTVQSPTTQDLTDIWARSATDIWVAAGAGGLMLHSGDGATFNPVSTGFANTTKLVWGTADHVYVPTTLQYVLVYDGTKWRMDDTGTRFDTALSAITGTGNNDVWVFGFDRCISHFNGSWITNRPNFGSNYDGVSGAWAKSSTDITAITTNGYVLRNTTGPMFVGGNLSTGNGGFALSAQPFVAGASSITGLWGTSSTSLYTSGPPALLYHYNGTAWMPNQSGIKDISFFNRTHGTADTDVWSVGQHGATAHYKGETVSAPQPAVPQIDADRGNRLQSAHGDRDPLAGPHQRRLS